MNCGHDFKSQQSAITSEAENTFTIFASVGAEAVVNEASQGVEEDFHQESSTLVDGNDLYDSSADLSDQEEPNLQNTEDFELDLSEADNPDSEGWDIGATLTEDLSETAGAVSDDSENNTEEFAGFEVQGLGFDLSDDFEPLESQDANAENDGLAFETTPSGIDDNNEQKDIAFDYVEDMTEGDETNIEGPIPEPSNQEETVQGAKMDLIDFPEQDSEDSSEVEMSEISLETELELEDQKPETELKLELPVDLNDAFTETEQTLEVEGLQLDLETDSLEIETQTEVPHVSSELKIDPNEDEAHSSSSDEEPTPDR